MNKKITVIGSTNTDMVIKAGRIPAPGETILGGNFFMNPGGKGANQAVAAARLGGDVVFVGKTGTDIFGAQAAQLLQKEGIDTSFLISDAKSPSGIALIMVDKNGENSIAVASGANAGLGPADIKNAIPVIAASSIVLMQLEIPIPTVEYVATVAAKKCKVILNPAPAQHLSPDLLSRVHIITPNETEASILTGIKITDLQSAQNAAIALHSGGVDTVIITLGKEGALLYHEEAFTLVPGEKVQAIDTTAAGDVFNGALAVALSEGTKMVEAVAFACRAAAISVTRLGAQASAPYRKEIVF